MGSVSPGFRTLFGHCALESSLRTVAVLRVAVGGEALLRAPAHLMVSPWGGERLPPPLPTAAAVLLRTALGEQLSHSKA